MTLIKLGGGLTDISGKFGGVVFGRDASGLHMRSKTLAIQRTPTDAQKAQRNWYAGLKNAEHNGGVTPPDDPEEPKQFEAVIYRIQSYRFYGQRSLSPPETHAVTEDASVIEFFELWVDGHWDGLKVIPGLTAEMAVTLLAKMYWTSRTTLGATHEAALANALARLLAVAEFCIAGSMAVWCAFWAAMILALGYTTYLTWIARAMLEREFSWDCVLIHSKNAWAFGTIFQRPTKEMLDIQPCVLLPGPPLQIIDTGSTKTTERYRMSWNLSYQETVQGLAWNCTYAWDRIDTTYIGNAYLTNAGFYRCKYNRWWLPARDIPIGWAIPRQNACYWIPNFYDVVWP
jgi:hypothetical protein